MVFTKWKHLCGTCQPFAGACEALPWEDWRLYYCTSAECKRRREETQKGGPPTHERTIVYELVTLLLTSPSWILYSGAHGSVRVETFRAMSARAVNATYGWLIATSFFVQHKKDCASQRANIKEASQTSPSGSFVRCALRETSA